MLLKSLTYFDDAEATETPVLLAEKIQWEVVKETLLTQVNEYINYE